VQKLQKISNAFSLYFLQFGFLKNFISMKWEIKAKTPALIPISTLEKSVSQPIKKPYINAIKRNIDQYFIE